MRASARLARAPRSNQLLLRSTAHLLQPHTPAFTARALSSDAGSSSSEKKADADADAEAEKKPEAEAGAAEPEPEPAADEAELSAEEQLQARVTELEEQVNTKHDQMLRALAEADNARRRAAIDVENARKFGMAKFAKSLLDVADNLGRAADSVPEDMRSSEEQPVLKGLYEGVVMTEKTLIKTFEDHGMKRVWPIDEKFDPNIHEALFETPDPSKEPGTVAHVASAGFILHDRVIRAAGVGVVSKPQ